MKILLAEDDKNISMIAKMALEHFGAHQVEVAEDGEAALRLATTGEYDLILLDEMMPKMNGVLVCQNYLKLKPQPKPVIFLSAKSQDSDIREFQSLSLGHIPKPFDPTLLCQQISELLRRGNFA